MVPVETPKTRGARAALLGYRFALASIALFSGWLTLQNFARLTHPAREESPTEYIRAHPFDPAGYIAATVRADNSSLPTSNASAASAASAAILLAPSDPLALESAIRAAFANGRLSSAMDLFSRALDGTPDARDRWYAYFASQLTQFSMADIVSEARAQRWRYGGGFALYLCHAARPGTLPLTVGLALLARDEPNYHHELSLCVERALIASGDVASAYQFVLNTSLNQGTEAPYLRNGTFAAPLSGSRFDWTLGSGGEFRNGFFATTRGNETDARAAPSLRVEFSGRPIRGFIAEQYLVLPPGTFHLDWRRSAREITATDSVAWTIGCLPDSARQIATIPVERAMPSGDAYASASFSVPEHCDAQVLRLEVVSPRVAADGLRGTLEVGDVRVTRVR